MDDTQDNWGFHFAPSANKDLERILDLAAEKFGNDHVSECKETLLEAFADLREEPSLTSVEREDLSQGVRAFPMACSCRVARHLITFRVRSERGKKVIEVLNILIDITDI